jgi:hypothetical protein
LLDQLARSCPDQIRQRISGKSVWIRQGGDGIFSHVAYPFLGRKLRRVNNAMICRPSGPSPTFSYFSSNTMHADFCVEALKDAIAKHGPPEIMNTDQGSQFTGTAWITTLTEAGIRISMDGRGRYLDNIFIERLWRSLKQEAIYLEEIGDGFQARSTVKNWITFYNTERPHSALDRQTPDDAYWAGLEEQKAA